MPSRGLLVTLVAAAAAASWSCSTAPGDTPRTPGDTDTAPPVTRAVPGDPVPMVLPATGAETRWTQGLHTFAWRIRDAVTRTCAAENGISLPDEPPPMFVRFFELPDLELIRARGFTAGSAAAVEQHGVPDAGRRRQCVEEGRAAVRPLERMYSPVQRQWFDDVAAIRGNRQVTRALAGFAECLSTRGVRVGDENEFFAFLESEMNAVGGREAVEVERRLAADYATCMGPVEAVREPLRQRLRDEFERDHAREIDGLRQTLLPAIRALERRFAVPITFPTA